MQITLEELLLERERRADVQREMLSVHRAPLISFTMNIAGPTKTSPLIERAFAVGISLIRKEISDFELLSECCEYIKCGPVSIFCVKCDAKELKARLIKIESTHPLGRLFDMDVIDVDGRHLSRDTERGCIICVSPGRACAAGRLHPLSEIIAKTEGIMTEYFTRVDAERISELAKEALLSEVYTAPKPGLVDPESHGSHRDMEVFHFERSAEALTPYFEKCLLLGAEFKSRSQEELFPLLRSLGIDAEKAMYKATGGRNTHKGAIFSFGIILGAIGRLMRADGYIPRADEIFSEAKSISEPYLARDLKAACGSTAGERAFLEYGARGIRGEVMDGFPSLKEIALPEYKRALESGKNKNDAGVLTLLHLIRNVYDTCLYKRGGSEGVAYARARAEALIDNGEPTAEKIREMDADLTERNLSPGGCADLLALTYFLSSLDG